MDLRAEFRFNHNRKLETYADMAGMTIYRDVDDKITHLSYEDYSFGDPDEAWRERGELFGSDPDEERLSDKTCDRYFIDYWKVMGGPYRHDGSHYKTKEDLENEIKELEARAGRRAEAARLKAEAEEAEALKRRQEFIKRDRERREQKAREATKRRVAGKEERAKIKAAEWKRQHPNYGPPTPPPAPSRREADPFAFDRQWPVSARERNYAPRQIRSEQEAADRQYQETIARRMRQKEVMDSGREFSSPQRSYMVTWENPGITDVKLVRVVLGPYATGSTRTMTAAEEADYWYWKARGK